MNPTLVTLPYEIREKICIEVLGDRLVEYGFVPMATVEYENDAYEAISLPAPEDPSRIVKPAPLHGKGMYQYRHELPVQHSLIYDCELQRMRELSTFTDTSYLEPTIELLLHPIWRRTESS